jgi:hypothetical protein
MRNEADDAWLDVATTDGGIILKTGAASAGGSNLSLYFTGDTNTGVFSPGADTIAVDTAGVERMRLDSSGDLGLGVAPNDFGDARTFHIKGPSSEPAAIRLESGGDTADSNDLVIYKTDTNAYLRINGTDAFRIFMNNADRFVINSSQKVCIGTDTEGEATADNLTIADSGHCGITLRSGTSSVGTIFFSKATSGTDEYIGNIQYDHSSNFLKWTVNGSERLRIHSDGKISSVNGVNSGGNGTSGFQIDGVDTACYISVQGKAAGSGGAAGNALFQGWFGTANTFRVNCDGTVKSTSGVQSGGSGTSGYQISGVDTHCVLGVQHKSAANGGVAGNAILQTWFGNSNTFRVNCDGALTCLSSTETSDIALKTDIEPISNVLDKLQQITGYTYKFKINGHDSMGVIAQDVEKVFPELVGGKEGSKTLQYSGLIGALIESVKELSAKVTALEAS